MGFNYDLFGPGQNAILPSLLLQAQPSQATNQGLLGHATIDGNSAAEQLIPINAQEYVVTKIGIVVKTAGLANVAGDISTATGGGGVMVASPVWSGGFAVNDYVEVTGAALYPALPEATVLTSANLYYNNNPVEGAAAACDIYIFGDRIL